MRLSEVDFNQYRQHKKSKKKLIRLLIYGIVIGGLLVYLRSLNHRPRIATKTDTIQQFSVALDSSSLSKVIK